MSTEQPTGIPYGFCHCGCGERPKVSATTSRHHGYVKGEPRRFCKGHNSRKPDPGLEPQPCKCGCGQLTRLAPRTDVALGHRKGYPLEYALGHNRNTQLVTAEARIEHRRRWADASIEYGLCLCGCALRTAIAPGHRPQDGAVKGEPFRYRPGHNYPSERKPDRYAVRECGYLTPCWVWLLGRDKDGYGTEWRDGRQRRAHRNAWEGVHGPIPEGLQLDHLCRNPPCVNPDHLEPVTGTLNVRRGRVAKLTWEAVREIRASPDLQVVLAERFGVSATTISTVRARRTWVAP